MTRTEANRNLLLGVLALQMDFIDREQLIVAVNRWVTDKSRDLDQIDRKIVVAGVPVSLCGIAVSQGLRATGR